MKALTLTQPWATLVAVGENSLVDVMKLTRGTLRDVRARAKRGELPTHETDFGDFSPGRYGWVLEDVRALGEPIPARGMLGLWEVPEETQARISRQLGRP